MAIAKQIVRSGTSPAANYRAACLGKSDKDFLNKLKMVERWYGFEKIWEDCGNKYDQNSLFVYIKFSNN